MSTGNDGAIDTSQLTQFSDEVAPWTNMDEDEHLVLSTATVMSPCRGWLSNLQTMLQSIQNMMD